MPTVQRNNACVLGEQLNRGNFKQLMEKLAHEY